MRFTSAVLVSLSLLGLAVQAHASTITPGNYTISASGTPNGQSSVSVQGTIYITSTGLFELTGSDSITVKQGNNTVVFNAADTTDSTPNPYNGIIHETITDTSGNSSTLQFNIANANDGSPIAPVVAGNGGPVICFSTTACGHDSNTSQGSAVEINSVNGINTDGPVVLSSLTLTPAVSATPEPSSLMLLGTGIMGLAAAARRRLNKV